MSVAPNAADGEGGSTEIGNLSRDHALQMQELRERYHETIFAQADKYLKQSQQNQNKLLKVRCFDSLRILCIGFL